MADPPPPDTMASVLDWLFQLRATYQAVIDGLGPAQPFPDLLRSVGRHLDAAAGLMSARGWALPADHTRGHLTMPVSVAQSCRVGLALTADTVSLCDQLTAQAGSDAEAAWLLRALKRAALDLHRPALERRLEAISDPADG